MKKVLSCFKCQLAFPDFPVGPGLNCPQCGTELKVVRPLSKREVQRMRLNLQYQWVDSTKREITNEQN